ncbi:MAG: homocysteine biosynthesis protein, partial [Cyanobacteria bacterium J06649_4]
MRTLDDINDKIRQGNATAWTITEAKARIEELGIAQAAQTVDVVTTGTFEPMEGSGAVINLGHS